MPLDTQKQITLQHHFTSMGLNPSCSLCQHQEWTVVGPNVLMGLDQDGANSAVTNKEMIPVISLVCNHCGHTVLINAKIAGVVR